MDFLDYILIGTVSLVVVIIFIMLLWGRKYIPASKTPVNKKKKKRRRKGHLERDLGSKSYDLIQNE